MNVQNYSKLSIHDDNSWRCFSFTLCICKVISFTKPLFHPLKEGITFWKIASLRCFQMFHEASMTTSAKKGLWNCCLACLKTCSKESPGIHWIWRYVQMRTLKLQWKNRCNQSSVLSVGQRTQLKTSVTFQCRRLSMSRVFNLSLTMSQAKTLRRSKTLLSQIHV